MSVKNTLANKAKRREERADHKALAEKKRMLQARMNYLAYAPPATFEELEAEVTKLTDEANQETMIVDTQKENETKEAE